MLHQGEPIHFSGTFETLVGQVWTRIEDLSSYTITALISNPTMKKNLFFSTDGTGDRKITVDGATYTFVISKRESAMLKGICNVDLALLSDGEPVISDNTGTFNVKESELGQLLAAKKEASNED